MQSIITSITSIISGAGGGAQGNLAVNTSPEFTRADILQAEEAERERRINSKEFAEQALANAKYVSNLLKVAEFPRPVLSQGSKGRTRLIEELERNRRAQNQEECDARQRTAKVVASSIRALGWPLIAKRSPSPQPSEFRKQFDQSVERLSSLLLAHHNLDDAKRAEEQERARRVVDAQGQFVAQQNASKVSLDVQGHMVDAVSREEVERERRRNSKSEVFAQNNARDVARLVQNYREETLNKNSNSAITRDQYALPTEEEETLGRARAKTISEMILEARRLFELSRTAEPKEVLVAPLPEVTQSQNILRQPIYQPEHEAPQPVQTFQSVYVIAQDDYVFPEPAAPATRVAWEDPTPVVSSVPPLRSSAPVVHTPSPAKPSVSFKPTFERTYSTAGSLSPTIFPLRRSKPVESSAMHSSGESAVKPHYNVVIVPDATRSLSSVTNPSKVPVLARTTSAATFVETPQSFVAHPLSRSLSAHELSFMKKEASKHEKLSLKQTKKAEKLLSQSEKLKSKGKLEKAKQKQDAAFELRKEAMKHEESANKNKYGTVVLTPAPPTM